MQRPVYATLVLHRGTLIFISRKTSSINSTELQLVGQVSTKGTVALRAIPKWRLNKTKMKRRRRILRVMAKNLKMHGIDDYRFIYFLDSFQM